MSVLLIKLGKEEFDNIVVERNDGGFMESVSQQYLETGRTVLFIPKDMDIEVQEISSEGSEVKVIQKEE